MLLGLVLEIFHAFCIRLQVVKRELQNIDDAWKQPRFDSLPHVVGVLTSRNPEAALEKLREQRDAIEELVDDVVRIYHNGFNKAIHNYSQVCMIETNSRIPISSQVVSLVLDPWLPFLNLEVLMLGVHWVDIAAF